MNGIGRRNRGVYAGLAILAVVAAGLFLAVGPPNLLATTDRPDFCMRCHVMESNYEAWLHAGAHRSGRCVDCHLPNQNAGLHYIWKSLDGLKDAVVFYSGRVPERIRLSSHGQAVLQGNCVRCHDATVAMTDRERPCWSCHRKISHQLSGALETS